MIDVTVLADEFVDVELEDELVDVESENEIVKGDKGDPGEGVAKGGRAGQILAKKSNDDYDTEWVDPSAGGASSWQEVQNKPFESVGSNLLVVGGVLKVDTTDSAEEDNTRPITSAGTYAIVGNINTLLSLI